ncbi:MAG: hypothetical protein R2755_08835 [Acidimicrobiales bacterium]
MATDEALAHDNYKNKIVAIDEEGTVVTRCHSGKPCRLIRNQFTDSWEGREDEIMPFPMQTIKVGAWAAKRALRRADRGRWHPGRAERRAGAHVRPAGDVVRDVMAEAEAVLRERFGVAFRAGV